MATNESTTLPYVQAFAVAMEAKLAENRHKGDRTGWLEVNPLLLLARLHKELEELERAIQGVGTARYINDDVIREAADVANYAMMIADACGELVIDEREGEHADR